MSIQTITIDSKSKVKIVCSNQTKFLDLDTYDSLYYSLHGILRDGDDVSLWIKTNSISNNYLFAFKNEIIYFYNYGLTPISLSYDDDFEFDITPDFSYAFCSGEMFETLFMYNTAIGYQFSQIDDDGYLDKITI